MSLISDADPVAKRPRPHIVFLISVDWFFVSHFVHLAKRAQDIGFRVVVMTRLQKTGLALADLGFDVIDLPSERRGQRVSGLLATVRRVRQALSERPDALLHGFGLFGIVVGVAAIGSRRAHRAIYTITGRGYLAADESLAGAAKRRGIRAVVASVVDHASVHWIAENATDLQQLGLDRARRQGRTTIVGGAGVDPDKYTETPLPAGPPIRCLLVARAIWSKGIDIAVEAVQRVRASGTDVELTIAAGLDPANPRAYSKAQMEEFAAKPGVRWLGHVTDVAGLWPDYHVAVLPSRGGEGVPKSLLEAAASGRSIITTDVAGCRELAERTGGRVVAAGDAAAFAEALGTCDVQTLGELGKRARGVVVEHYSENAVWRRVCGIYLDCPPTQ